MTEVILRKRGASLIPVDDQGSELLAKLKDGRDVKVKITQSRNLRHHRLFWALVEFLCVHGVDKHGNSLFEDLTKQGISSAIKLAIGCGNDFVDLDTGKRIFVPRSISFENMSQVEFNEFFEKACDVVCKRWMPRGTTPKNIHDELIRMVDGEHALPERVA